jgi:hypothetical protein
MHFGPLDPDERESMDDHPTRRAVRSLTGLSDDELTDLGGFAGDTHVADRLEDVSLARGADRDVVARLFNFAVVLRAAGLMPRDEDEYWERPWKWDPEYRAWTAHGQPSPGDWLTDRFAAFTTAAVEASS